MTKSLLLLSCALLVLCGSVLGQINISTNNYQPAPGTTIDFRFDINFNAAAMNTMLAGSGGPNVWDFSSRSYGTDYILTSVSTVDVPSVDSFPTANMALRTVVTGDTIWTVFNSVASSLTTLGTVSKYSGSLYYIVYQSPTPDWVFPIGYNSSWTSHRLTVQSTGFTTTYTYDTTQNVVDAWGTVKYGSNSIACLRVISTEKILLKTYDNLNDLLDTSLTTNTTANFIGSGFKYLVSGTHSVSNGYEGFNGSISNDLLNSPTDVQQITDGDLPKTFELSQNYPNPFNPSTEINFSVPVRSQVNLSVYDILGRQVNALVDGSMSAGNYVVDWNGTNRAGEPVASGVYFYKLTAGNYSAAKKMVLLK